MDSALSKTAPRVPINVTDEDVTTLSEGGVVSLTLADEEGSNQTAVPDFQPRVCSHCYNSWRADRFQDIGRHQIATLGARDEDCLFWKVLSSESVQEDAEAESVEPHEPFVPNDADDSSHHLSDVTFYTSSETPLEITNKVRIIPEAKIYLPLIKTWLSTCENEHPKCNQAKFAAATLSAVPSTSFLLVDIDSQQIVSAKLSTRFIALSYVWGGVKQLNLTEVLYDELTQPGGLLKYESQIPQTIKDAMSVATGLGEKYLWVDCLCIIQDRASDKRAQIDNMAAIYDAALLTIVAGTATSANDPLPGVQPGSRNINSPITRQHGILFAKDEYRLLMATLPRLPHSRRAWTFQEVILSRRCLLFLGGEVMLQCHKCLFRENTPEVSLPGPQNQTGNWPPLDDSFLSLFFRYRELVHLYSMRSLSFESDRKDAFTGITKALELTWGWNFSYCLPAEEFDWAILWTGVYSEDESKQREEKEKELANRDLPTWSWLSHAGQTLYLIEKESAGYLHPYLEWKHATVWDGVEQYKLLDRSGDRGTGPSIFEGLPPGTIVTIGMVMHLPHMFPTPSSASFSATREEMAKQGSYGSPCAPLIDDDGVWCGTINGITEEQLAQLLLPEEAELSLVLLSAPQKTWVLGGFRKSKAPYDTKEYEEGEFKTVNVMLVKWDNRLASRVAIGEMHIEAWKKGESEGDVIRFV